MGKIAMSTAVTIVLITTVSITFLPNQPPTAFREWTHIKTVTGLSKAPPGKDDGVQSISATQLAMEGYKSGIFQTGLSLFLINTGLMHYRLCTDQPKEKL